MMYPYKILSLSVALALIACGPSSGPSSSSTPPTPEPVDEIRSSLELHGASLVGGALPGGSVISAAVSSMSINPYDGIHKGLLAAVVWERSQIFRDGELFDEGDVVARHVLYDFSLSADGEAPIHSIELAQEDGGAAIPFADKTSSGRVAVSPMFLVQRDAMEPSNNLAYQDVSLPGGRSASLAAVSVVSSFLPDAPPSLRAFSPAAAGEPIQTFGPATASMSVPANSMPNRISMNVTVPKQTQGATFGEKVNAGLHAAGSALAQGASIVVSSEAADMLSVSAGQSLAEESTWELPDMELMDVRFFDGSTKDARYAAVTPASASCSADLAGKAPAKGRESRCDVYVWKLTDGSGPAPLTIAADSPTQKISGLVLAATLIQSPIPGTAASEDLQLLLTFEPESQTVQQYVLRPSSSGADGVEIHLTTVSSAPLDDEVLCVDGRFDAMGRAWSLTATSFDTTLFMASPSEDLLSLSLSSLESPRSADDSGTCALAIHERIEVTQSGATCPSLDMSCGSAPQPPLSVTAVSSLAGHGGGGGGGAAAASYAATGFVVQPSTNNGVWSADVGEFALDLMQGSSRPVRFTPSTELSH